MAQGTAAPVPPPLPPTGPAQATVSDEHERFIEAQLRKTKRRVKRVDLFGGLLTLAAGVLLYLLTCVVLDHWIVPGGLGPGARVILLSLLVVVATGYTAWILAPALFGRVNPVYAAYTIEQSSPALKNSLINFLLLRKRREGVAPVVFDAIEKRAASDLTKVALDAAVDRSRLVKLGYGLVALLTVGCLYKVFSPKDPVASIERVIAPWAELAAPTRVEITDIQPGDHRDFHDARFTVSAIVRGATDAEPVRLFYSTPDGQVVDRELPMHMATGDYRYRVELPDTASGLQQDLEYWITAGDATSSRFKVSVVSAPTITIDTVEYKYPEYSQLGTDPAKPGTSTVKRQGDLQALEGTQVTLTATATHDLKSAYVDFARDGRRDLPMTVRGRQATVSFPLRLKPGTTDPEHTSYQLLITTSEGYDNPKPVEHKIDVVPDLPPTVKFAMPQVEPQQEQPLSASGGLSMVIEAQDPDYKVATVTLVTERNGQPLASESLLPEPRTGKVRVPHVFQASRHKLQAGDKVIYWAVVEDNKQPKANRAESPKYTLRVVSPQDAPQDQLAKNDPRQPQDKSQQGKPNDGQPQKQPGQQGDEKSGDPKQGEGKQGDKQGSDKQENSQQGDSKQSDSKQGEGKQNQPQQGQNQPGDKPQPGDQQKSGDKQQPGDKQEGKQPGDSQKQSDSKGQGEQQSGDKQGGEKGDESSKGEEKPNLDAPGPKDQQQQSGGQQDQKGQPPQEGQQQSGSENSSGQNGQSQPGGSQQSSGDQKSGGDQKSSQPGEGQPGEQSDKHIDPETNPGEAIEKINDFFNEREKSPSESGQQNGKPQPNQQPSNQQQPQDKNASPSPSGGQGKESPQKPNDQNDKASPQQQPGEGTPAEQKQSQPGDQAGQPDKQDGKQPDGTTGAKQDPGTTGEGSPKPGEGEKSQGEAKPNSDGQPPAEKSQDKTAKGGDSEAPKGEAGDGKSSNDNKGSPSPQEDANQRDKQPGQSPPSSDQSPSDANRAKSPSNSTSESDAKGDSSGDRSGGGEEGSGQKANQKGTGGPGSNTAADEGGAPSKEKGDSATSDRGGDKVQADGKTDGKPGNKPGEGSTTRPSGEKPGGEQTTKADQKTQQSKQQKPSDKSGTPTPGEQPTERTGAPGSQNFGQGQDTRLGPPPQHQANEPGQSDPNLDYARKATELALERLKHELNKGEPDPELLKRGKWTRDDLQRIVDSWDKRFREAQTAGDKNPDAQRRLDELLRGLGLRPRGTTLKAGQVTADTQKNMREQFRGEPPAEYRAQYRAFSKGLSQGRETKAEGGGGKAD